MKTVYKNIPVRKELYEKVKVIAEANGLGERGMGAQVEKWVARELPECEHPKTAVVIDIFPSNDLLPGTHLQRYGWFCQTCNRVYQRLEKMERIENDPYVQAIGSTTHIRSAMRDAEAKKVKDTKKKVRHSA